MTETTAAPNNRAVAFSGRATRERSRMPYTPASFAAKHNKKLAGTPAAANAAAQATAMESKGVDPGIAIATASKRGNAQLERLKKRGIVSDRAAERHLGGLDQQPIDASAR